MIGTLRTTGRGLVAMAAAGLVAFGGWLAAGPVAPRPAGVERAAEPRGQAGGSAVEVVTVRLPTTVHTKPIEEIRVGDRVLGRNPDRSDTDPLAPDPDPSWQVL